MLGSGGRQSNSVKDKQVCYFVSSRKQASIGEDQELIQAEEEHNVECGKSSMF